jgi:two-component system CheB/CheR fusion protein
MITGQGDIATAVHAMKAGAVDFIEKPIGDGELLTIIERALDHAPGSPEYSEWRAEVVRRETGLTKRQREILGLVVAGHPNKEIAARLGINQRTVESHRAIVMKKMGAKSLTDLVRLSLAAT